MMMTIIIITITTEKEFQVRYSSAYLQSWHLRGRHRRSMKAPHQSGYPARSRPDRDTQTLSQNQT